jgi:ABC-type dipeptide/oligopeptide/nickel transport system permease subunit
MSAMGALSRRGLIARDAPMLLGADAYGRDNFSRLLYGGRATLAVAFIATLAAACLGMLLPAARGYVLTQASLLLPAFILAEATMSYVGLGFQGDVATWGTMLHDASNVALLGDAPWTLAPAVPIFLVTLGVNVAARDVQRASI